MLCFLATNSLSEVRRLKTELRWVQCSQKMPACDSARLKAFVDKVVSTDIVADKPAAKKVRMIKLRESNESNISIDSNGSINLMKMLSHRELEAETVYYPEERKEAEEEIGEEGEAEDIGEEGEQEEGEEEEDSMDDFEPVPSKACDRKEVMKRPEAHLKKKSASHPMKKPAAKEKAKSAKPKKN